MKLRTAKGPNFTAIFSIGADMSCKYFTLRTVGIATVLHFLGLPKRFLSYTCSMATTYEVIRVGSREGV